MEVKQFAQGCRAKSSRAGMWTQPDPTPEPMIPHLLSTSGPKLDPSQTQHGERRPVRLLEAPRSMRDGTPRPLGDQDLTPSIPPIPDDQAPSRGHRGSLDHPKQWGLCIWLGRILPRSELSARNTRDRMLPGLAVTASEAALYYGGVDGGVKGDVKLGQAEGWGQGSDWQRWLTQHLKMVTSEPLETHKNSQDGEWEQIWRILGCGDRLLEYEWQGLSNILQTWGSDLKLKPWSQFLWRGLYGGLILNLPVWACKCVCISVGLKCLIMRLSAAISDPITSSPDKDLRQLACVVSCQIPWPSWN